jgi:UDP-N-acetyl-2-amino-2-deoxyglucuronate dehydrogenase
MAQVSPVAFALVGCGKIARKHAAALRSLPAARIAAVCDLDRKAADALGAELGVPAYGSVEEMARGTPFDAACVLVPSGHHGKVAAALAALGRHVVVEKPFVLRAEEGRAILAECERKGVGLFVVNQNRCNRPVVRLREALDAGRLGTLVLGTARVRWKRTEEYYGTGTWRGTWRLDWGVIANQALHHLDMLLWLMGEVESVQAMTSTRLAKIEAEDTAAVILRFRSGATGILEATTATRPKDIEGSISVLGSGGTVEVGGFSMDRLVRWEFEAPLPGDDAVRAEDAANPKEFAWNHARYLESVAARIAAGAADRREGEEACRVVEVLEACYDAAASGCAARPGVPLGLSRLGKG